MGYVAPTWQNGGPPALNAKNMQDISDNLAYVSNNMVNPNLLDNWYFGNPVNQRNGYVITPGSAYRAAPNAGDAIVGQTDGYYTAKAYNSNWWTINIGGTDYYVYNGSTQAVPGYTGTDTYTVDRWITDNTVTVVDGGIKCKQSGQAWLLWQRLDDALAKIIAGRVVTYSALTSAGLLTKTISLPPVNETWDIDGGNATLGDLEMDMTQSGGKKCLRFYSTVDGTEVTILAVKLELGTQQTLAHQENGVWVLNEIPDYGEQLRRCQRYFIRVGDTRPSQNCAAGFANCANASTGNAFIHTPVSMRATPAAVLHNVWLRWGINQAEVTGINVFYAAANGIYCALQSSGLPAESTVLVRTENAGYIDFSADL